MLLSILSLKDSMDPSNVRRKLTISSFFTREDEEQDPASVLFTACGTTQGAFDVFSPFICIYRYSDPASVSGTVDT